MSRWAGALGPGLKPQQLPAGPAPLAPFLNSLPETRGSQGLTPHSLVCSVKTSTGHLVGDLRALCPWQVVEDECPVSNEEAAQIPELSTEERMMGRRWPVVWHRS